MTKKIRVCNSRSCSTFGARRVMETVSEEIGLKPGEHNEAYDLDYCGCTGYCSRSPNLVIDDKFYVFSTSPETVLQDIESGGEDMTGREIDLTEVDFLGDLTDEEEDLSKRS